MSGKYAPLGEFLRLSPGPRLRLSFAQVEFLIGAELPASARKHREWWSNEKAGTHRQAQAWMTVGYRVQRLNLPRGIVLFERAGDAEA